MKNSEIEILFIGLVDFNTESGDAVHFRKLTNYLTKYYKGNYITLTSGKSIDTHKKIKFPSNRIYRLLYWNFIILFHSLLFFFKNKNIKCVYFRESGLIITPYLLKILFFKKLIIEINGVNIDDLGINKKITFQIFKSLYKIPTLFTASKGYVELLKEVFNVSDDKFIKVQLGYDSYRQPIKEESIEFLNLSVDKRYILFIGNVNKYQGIQNVLPALSNLIKKEKDIVLLIIGDGVYLTEIKKLVTELGINENVVFYNRVSNGMIKYFVSVSQIGLSPFDFDRGLPGTISGLKTYDYLFGGLPILTSEMDDMASFIKANKLGDFIKKGDSKELIQETIVNMLNNNKDFKQEVQNRMSFFYDNFSWENRFERIYLNLKKILKK